MGGGGLVILRHKSWHVWNQDNVERVLADEAQEREEKEEQRETQFTREAQARHDVLQNRARARVRKQALTHGIALEEVFDRQPELLAAETQGLRALPAPSPAGSGGHINLFADEENLQRQKEEKAEAEKGKRKRKELAPVIPDEVFRGADKDSRGFVPWYTTGAQENSQVDELVKNKKQATKAKKRLRGGLSIDMKTLDDPLTAMNALLNHSKPLLLQSDSTAPLQLGMEGAKEPLALMDHNSKPLRRHRSPSSSRSRSRSTSKKSHKKSKKKSHKAKKQKKAHKGESRESSDSDSESSRKKKHKKSKSKHKKGQREQEDLLGALRRGRLEREREEKLKAQALLAKVK